MLFILSLKYLLLFDIQIAVTICEDNIKMDFDWKGNGCKEQIKLTENRVNLWTFVYKVKNFQYKRARFIGRLSINVSPHSGLVVVAMSNTATATLIFWNSVSKSACSFFNFSVSMSRRMAGLFLFSLHTSVLIEFYLLYCTFQHTAVSIHEIISDPPSVESCSTQYLIIYLLLLASWMMFSKPHNKPYQLTGWLVNNKSEGM